MTDSRVAQHPALPNNPVGSIIGEFMVETTRKRNVGRARTVAPRKWNAFVLPFLVVACVALWAAPALMPPPAEALTAATVDDGARLNLYLASLRVREHLAAHRQLPATLEEAGVQSAGIDYARGARSDFELSAVALGSRLVYRSTIPDSVFLGSQRIRGIR